MSHHQNSGVPSGNAWLVDRASLAPKLTHFAIAACPRYTSTSSVPLQIQILDLLNILLALRVNYTLLDSDMLFVKSILKQLELIEHGHVRNVQDLLSHLFRFLAQLAREHNKLGDKLNMPRLLQLCDHLLASVHLAPRNALPALKPIVQEIFLSGRSKSKRPEKEAEYMALREVVTNTLIKQVRARMLPLLAFPAFV